MVWQPCLKLGAIFTQGKMLRNKRISKSGLRVALSSTSYPPFVIKNNSLAGIIRSNKFIVPLHLYNTHVNTKKVPKVPKGAKEVNIIPPTPSTSHMPFSGGNQKGSGSLEAKELMQYPIHVNSLSFAKKFYCQFLMYKTFTGGIL